MEPMRRSQPRLPRLMMLLPLGAAVGLLAPGCWKQPSTAGLPCNSASECDAGQQCVAGECAAETDSASAPGVRRSFPHERIRWEVGCASHPTPSR